MSILNRKEEEEGRKGFWTSRGTKILFNGHATFAVLEGESSGIEEGGARENTSAMYGRKLYFWFPLSP